MFALLFSPEESRTAEQIVLAELRPWLHLVHTQSPGARVFVGCCRLESPPPDCPDPDTWRQRVRDLAEDVQRKARGDHRPTLPSGDSSRNDAAGPLARL